MMAFLAMYLKKKTAGIYCGAAASVVKVQRIEIKRKTRRRLWNVLKTA